MDNYMIRLNSAKEGINELLESKSYDFATLRPSDLEEKLPVVYAIFDKSDGSCLYVGRTKDLRRRLYTNHLMGPVTNARLKKYLIGDDDFPDINSLADAKKFLISRCCFKYLAVPDVRARGQLEGLLSYLLDVRYIHEEH